MNGTELLQLFAFFFVPAVIVALGAVADDRRRLWAAQRAEWRRLPKAVARLKGEAQ